jgi:hypothetical protein
MDALPVKYRLRKTSLKLAMALVLVTMFFSCKTYEVFNIEVWEPAKIIVPQSVQNVLIAHNMSHLDEGRATRYQIYGKDYYDTVYYDTAYARAAIETLAGMINFNNRFYAVAIDTLNVKLPELSEDFTVRHIEAIKSLCIENDTEALLLLSSIDRKIDYEIFSSYLGGFFSVYTIYLSTRWLFIDPFAQKLLDQKLMNDTLYYRIEGYWGTAEEGLYISGRDLLITAAEESALSFGARITPHIVQTPRVVFKSGDKNIRRGYKEAIAGNWLDAALLWRNTLKKADPVIRARGSFNLALASEMEGLLDPALVWAEESFRNFPDSLNQTYIEILRERIRQQDDLILQLEGE